MNLLLSIIRYNQRDFLSVHVLGFIYLSSPLCGNLSELGQLTVLWGLPELVFTKKSSLYFLDTRLKPWQSNVSWIFQVTFPACPE